MMKDVAITGLSAISAAGIGVESLWQAVRDNSTCLTPIPVDIQGDEGHLWGKASAFRIADFLPPLKARKYDRCSQLAVAATGMALKDAGIDMAATDLRRVGIVIGCGFGGIVNSHEFLSGYFRGGVEGLAPVLFPNTVANAAASNAAIEHGLKGPNVTLVQRFCSAEGAMITALKLLEDDRADIIVTGGVDELCPIAVKGFAAVGQLRKSAQGFGEGAGMMVLERAAGAKRRKARVRSAISSVATVGLLLQGAEEEGVTRLLGTGEINGTVSLSGTVRECQPIMQRIASVDVLDIAPVVGRSLAMGGLAMVVLTKALETRPHGIHIAASPEGPYFAVKMSGGSSV